MRTRICDTRHINNRLVPPPLRYAQPLTTLARCTASWIVHRLHSEWLAWVAKLRASLMAALMFDALNSSLNPSVVAGEKRVLRIALNMPARPRYHNDLKDSDSVLPMY